jgi:hypothetical protein
MTVPNQKRSEIQKQALREIDKRHTKPLSKEVQAKKQKKDNKKNRENGF